MLEDLRKCNKAVGIKQTIKAVENNSAKAVFIAKDADEKVIGSLKALCLTKSVELEYVDTMKQLGKAVGIEVGASAVCLLK
ncbi:MAG TPA: ribosomal L7Ae/L30e/S12e/Gadd45 family protein [Clostridia bacterium]|nr:ribosomal L7Ae/L30e/S12e/Gadd45 family protein [Clostridia bacterium]